MKFSITFKTPGALDTVVDSSKTEEEQEELQAEVADFAGRWIEHDEYVTIDFDTEAETATVREL